MASKARGGCGTAKQPVDRMMTVTNEAGDRRRLNWAAKPILSWWAFLPLHCARRANFLLS